MMKGRLYWGRLRRALHARHARTVRDEFARDALAAAVLPSEPFVRPDRGPLLGEPDPMADAVPVPIREVVEDHPQGMFLTGEPGNGKGAVLRWLADSIAYRALDGGGYRRAGVKVPVYVALDRLPNESLDSARGVMEAIGETLVRTCGLADDGPDDGEIDREVLAYVAREYGLVVLLDGLNRIVARSKALVSVEEAMRELQKMPSVKVIVCSRAHVGNATALPEFRLCGLESREDSIGFLERQAAVRGESQGEGASRYERMVRMRMTKGHLSSPFMLWLADQTLERLSTPVTRSVLYSAFHDLAWERAQGAVERADAHTSAPANASAGACTSAPVSAHTSAPTSDARKILAAHCYHTLASRHDGARELLGVGEWAEWMDRHGGAADAERVLDTLAEHTELVTRTGIPENPYTLFHPTFIEFYAAEYLAGHSDSRGVAEQVSAYLGHPSFDNMLVFLAATIRPEDREALFEALLSWDSQLAAQAVAEWHDPTLAARLPREGGLLLRAGRGPPPSSGWPRTRMRTRQVRWPRSSRTIARAGLVRWHGSRRTRTPVRRARWRASSSATSRRGPRPSRGCGVIPMRRGRGAPCWTSSRTLPGAKTCCAGSGHIRATSGPVAWARVWRALGRPGRRCWRG